MANFFNRATSWMTSQIIECTSPPYDPSRVAAAISSLIRCGTFLKNSRNYDGVMMVIASLNTTCVSRLASAWALLSKEDQASYDELSELMKKNYKVKWLCF
jgi:hypothetical protein